MSRVEADLGKVLLRMGRLEPLVDKRRATGESSYEKEQDGKKELMKRKGQKIRKG